MKVKHCLLALGGMLLLLQLFPIDQNLPVTKESEELHVLLKPPPEVMSLLKNACYDCHSNHTRWPWYAGFQPVGWWLQDHVREGKAELNFSEFGRLDVTEREKALHHCAKLIAKGAMPLRDYLRLHPEARLDEHEKQLLIDWLQHPVSVSTTPTQDDCDHPDADVRCCFVNRPPALTPLMRIAPDDEPGERLVIQGRVLRADGRTAIPNTVLYAYHTNVTGHYTKKGDESGIQRRHGRLHGWCQTDAQGHYEIHTIRPAHYPGNQVLAHIHAAVWRPDNDACFYINEFVFADDDLLDDRHRAAERQGRGGSGIVRVQQDAAGTWRGQRDIILK